MIKDSEQLEKLIQSFKRAEERVSNVLADSKTNTVQKLKISLDKTLKSINLELKEETKNWANNDLRSAYREGANKIGELPKGKTDNGFNREVVLNPYIEISDKLSKATETTRNAINQIIDSKSKNGLTSIYDVKKAIEKEMQKQNGSLIVEYNNGAKVPLSAYASMCARTERIVTSNTGSINRCQDLGIDLVRCTKVANCCPYCKYYEDKIYSISGKDKRFPPLYGSDGPFKSGYNIMHPNCRHEFLPFVEKLYTENEIQELQKQSKTFTKRAKDDKIFDVYNKNQSYLKQLNSEYVEYKSLKSQYGDDFPYKTLGSFRRGKRADSETYRKIIRQLQNSIKNTKSVTVLNSKDLQEVNAKLKSFIDEVEIDKLTNLNNINIVAEKLSEITQKYGIKIKRLDLASSATANASATFDAIRLNQKYFNSNHKTRDFRKEIEESYEKFFGYKSEGGEIYLRNKKQIDAVLSTLEEKYKYDRFTYADESGRIEDTILHECGHVIHNQLMGLGPNGYKIKDFMTESELKTALQFKDKWQFDIATKLSHSDDIYKIGYYANKNQRELFAECFVAYETGRKIPKYVEEFFDEFLGGKKK